jgi:CheY-like chemotaxis protein
LLSQKDKRWINIHFTDTGRGMSEDELSQLFTPFSRLSSAKDIEGVGLGMTITQILTEANQGEVYAKSKAGEGTTITLRFPRLEAIETPADIFSFERSSSSLPSEKLAADFPSPEALVSTPERAYKIIVVDDDPDLVSTLCRSLEAAGASTLQAFSVKEALCFCNFEKPDAILCDSSMPDGGIRSLAKSLKGEKSCPILLCMTGTESEQLKRDIYHLGVVAVLPKPVDPDEILEILAEAEKRNSQVA